MSTKREQILSYLKNLLDENDLEVPVFRNRVSPFISSTMPAIVIEPGEDPASDNMTEFTDWLLDIVFAIYAEGESPASVADPIIKLIHQKLFEDTSLGGLSLDITAKGYKPTNGDGGTPWAIFELIYTVSYRTRTNDLTI